MMQIGAFLFRWLDILAALVLKLHHSWHVRRTAIVTREDRQFVVSRLGKATANVIARVPAGAQIPPETAEALRNHFLIFELAPENIVARRLKVPAQARDFAAGIVSNQIERLSPWPLGQAVYGFEALPNPQDAALLDIQVLIAARANIETIRESLTASGLAPSQISARSRPGADTLVALWTRTAHVSRSSQNLSRRIGISLAGAVFLSALVSLWAAYSANSLQGQYDAATLQVEVLQRQDEMARAPQNLADLNPSRRAWALKAQSPAAVLVLDALTRAIPDAAYLTQLHMDGANLRIIGQAADPPSLIAALTHSKDFSEVHFSSPTVKSEDSGFYEFSIAAHIVPHAGH